MSEGFVDKARTLAFRLLHTPRRNEIIEMFKVDMPEDKTCQCGKVLKHVFEDIWLRYKIAKKCNTCVEKEKTAKRLAEEALDKEKRESFLEGKAEEVASIMSMAGVPPGFINANLEDFSRGFEPKNYFITGDVGRGKTHLAVAMLREHVDALNIIKNGDEYRIAIGTLPVFINVAELLLDIRRAFSVDSPMNEIDLIDKYADTPFLILDDIGIEKTTEWALQTLYVIINRRCTDPFKRTIITSNLELGTIEEKLSERISSRIRGMCKTINLKGRDRRLEDGA